MTAVYQCMECREDMEDLRGSLGIRNCLRCAGAWVQKARRAGAALCLRSPGRLPPRDYRPAIHVRRMH